MANRRGEIPRPTRPEERLSVELKGMLLKTASFQAGVRDLIAHNRAAVTRVMTTPLLKSFTQTLNDMGCSVVSSSGASMVDRERERFRFFIDTIDGGRGLRAGVHEAWVQTAIVRPRNGEANLSDVVMAVMTEIPVEGKNESRVVWAAIGEGAWEDIEDMRTGILTPFPKALHSSSEIDPRKGFIVFAAPWASTVKPVADLQTAVFEEIAGRPLTDTDGWGLNHQVLTSAGQIYHLANGGYDAFFDCVAMFNRRGQQLGLATRADDVAGMLIAQEAGAVVYGEDGGPLRAPLDARVEVSWRGYANQKIADIFEPVIRRYLSRLSL